MHIFPYNYSHYEYLSIMNINERFNIERLGGQVTIVGCMHYVNNKKYSLRQFGRSFTVTIVFIAVVRVTSYALCTTVILFRVYYYWAWRHVDTPVSRYLNRSMAFTAILHAPYAEIWRMCSGSHFNSAWKIAQVDYKLYK